MVLWHKNVYMLKVLIVSFILSGICVPDKIHLKDYYKHISNSKVYFVENKYEFALDEYKIAFKKKNKPFFVDIKNALVVAEHLGDKCFIKTLSEFLNKKGLKLQESKDFDFSTTKDFISSLKSKQIIKNDILLNIFENDQNVRPNRPFLSEVEIKSRDSMDHVNYSRFITMVEKYGFPTEEEYGYFVGETNLWQVVNVLCVHFILSGYHNEILELLDLSFHKGDIPNGVYANLIDRSYDSFQSGSSSVEHRYLVKIGAKDYYNILDKSKAIVDAINSRRAEIFLDSLHISQNYFLSKHYCIKKFLNGYTPEPYAAVEFLPYQIFGDEKSNPDLIKINLEKYKCQ